jgi:hypothetical protein
VAVLTAGDATGVSVRWTDGGAPADTFTDPPGAPGTVPSGAYVPNSVMLGIVTVLAETSTMALSTSAQNSPSLRNTTTEEPLGFS